MNELRRREKRSARVESEPSVMSDAIYLDYNASTPLAPEVIARMAPLLTSAYGNPSSRHFAGAPAREVIDHARAEVASLLAAAAEEIVFTSGGTEVSNGA